MSTTLGCWRLPRRLWLSVSYSSARNHLFSLTLNNPYYVLTTNISGPHPQESINSLRSFGCIRQFNSSPLENAVFQTFSNNATIHALHNSTVSLFCKIFGLRGLDDCNPHFQLHIGDSIVSCSMKSGLHPLNRHNMTYMGKDKPQALLEMQEVKNVRDNKILSLSIETQHQTFTPCVYRFMRIHKTALAVICIAPHSNFGYMYNTKEGCSVAHRLVSTRANEQNGTSYVMMFVVLLLCTKWSVFPSVCVWCKSFIFTIIFFSLYSL